ncbi:MAG: hypothetical protein ABI723_01835 [Bacteroidia bacterium]
MQNLFKISTVLIFLSASFFTSCKKDDNSSTLSTNTIVTSGSWRVTYYHEINDDHTSDFNGYTFIFNSNGTIAATNSSGTTNGSWSSDDSNNEVHIDLGNIDPLKELSKGWLVISKTETEIKLQDDNSAHTEELHFTKN